jgi:hypothetical protein
MERKRKRKSCIDQVEIYFVDAKRCQGISELEVFNHLLLPCLANLLQACDEDAFASMK